MYEFTKELETGNSMIDNQHRQLISLINQLLDACKQGKGRGVAEQALQFLNDYTIKHFSDEEALQKKTGYPGYAQHHLLHEGFKKVVLELMEEYKKTGPTIVLVGKINSSVGGWLINHIKTEDKKVAAHAKASV